MCQYINPSKLQPRSVKILSSFKKVDRVVKEAAKKQHWCKIPPKLIKQLPRSGTLKFVAKNLSSQREISQRREKLPCPYFPHFPLNQDAEKVTKSVSKKEMPLGKMPLYTDCWACFPHPKSKQMLASIPVRTYALAKCFAGCLCCQNYNKVCLEFEGKT